LEELDCAIETLSEAPDDIPCFFGIEKTKQRVLGSRHIDSYGLDPSFELPDYLIVEIPPPVVYDDVKECLDTIIEILG